MTRDDIIRMAREAGFVVDEKSQQHQPNCIFHTWHMIDEALARFAALVAAAERERLKWNGIHSCGPDCDRPACVNVRKAVEAEREASWGAHKRATP